MAAYRAPLRDMRFVLHELHGLERINALPAYAEATVDVIDGVLDYAANDPLACAPAILADRARHRLFGSKRSD